MTVLQKMRTPTHRGHTNADWAGNITDGGSTSGYCTFVEGNFVTWRSEKQNVVAKSSAEAEFRSVAHGIWLCG